MHNVTATQRLFLAGAFAVMLAGSLVTGCQKHDEPTQAQLDAAATDDVVASISGAVGDENGGASNNVGDLIALASPDGIAGLSTNLAKEYGTMTTSIVDSSYDPVTGWWTLTVTHEKNSSSDQYYTKLSRTYKIQFLKNNVPQRYWRVQNGAGIDTANVIKKIVVSGTGEYRTPHVHHILKSVTASFIATNTNTDVITVNSDAPYVRSGLDTITTANAVRTLDHTVSMTFTNITGPRLRPASVMFTRKNLMNQTTGTITGVYTANVTVQRGSTYKEKTIEREFTVTLGNGEGTIGIHGDGRRFKTNLLTGEQKF
jgi:hypothetical protein